MHQWDKYFAKEEPNAQAGFKADEEQAMVTFEMFKPKLKLGKMIFNIKPLTDSGEDKLIEFQGIEMSDIHLLDNGPLISFDAAICSFCRLSAVNMPFEKFYPF